MGPDPSRTRPLGTLEDHGVNLFGWDFLLACCLGLAGSPAAFVPLVSFLVR